MKVATKRLPELDLMKPSAVGICDGATVLRISAHKLKSLKCSRWVVLDLRERVKDRELRIYLVNYPPLIDSRWSKPDGWKSMQDAKSSSDFCDMWRISIVVSNLNATCN